MYHRICHDKNVKKRKIVALFSNYLKTCQSNDLKTFTIPKKKKT